MKLILNIIRGEENCRYRHIVSFVKKFEPKLQDLAQLKCPICGKKFESEQKLISHLGIGKCRYTIYSILNMAFKYYKKARYHIRSERRKTSKVEYVCTICEFSSTDKSEVILHIINKHKRELGL